MLMKPIKHLGHRLLFVLLTSTVLVFFSEKVFWYIQGYSIVELILFYAVPASVCLWVINTFQVQRLSSLVLVGGLFGFLVEGILTPVLYEGGLLDPVMPAYFISWHGTLSLVLGWYFIRLCLVEGHWKRTLLASMAIGLFWGAWSLVYRLPESIKEFQGLTEAGESFLPGAWPVSDFALYTLIFTGMLAAAHWLLGKGIWQRAFPLKKWEIILLGGILILLYLAQVFPVVPLGFLKLTCGVILVLIPMRMVQIRTEKTSILKLLDSHFQAIQLAPLLTLPLFASLVYLLADIFPPSEELLRGAYIGTYTLQSFFGGGIFIWAWADSIKIWRGKTRV